MTAVDSSRALVVWQDQRADILLVPKHHLVKLVYEPNLGA
jgi:hypothetical protein